MIENVGIEKNKHNNYFLALIIQYWSNQMS